MNQMPLVARALVAPLVELRSHEELVAVLRHPRAHPQLRIAVRPRHVDVVDAVLEQHIQSLIGGALIGARQGGGAEECAG